MAWQNNMITPESWMADIFSSKAARDGRVIRRKLHDIEHFVGTERFIGELARRGFHAIENSGQLVIFCNQEPIRRVL